MKHLLPQTMFFFYENPPGHPEIEMSSWVPKEIQDKFGLLKQYYAMDGNVPGGNILILDESRMDEIVKEMESHGFHCIRNDSLIEEAYGTSFNPEDFPVLSGEDE